jgi:hypothetical protein
MGHMDDTLRAKRYRALAAEIRAIAEDTRGDDRRGLLRKVATDYDRMALRFEAEAAAPTRRRRSA